MKNNFIIVVVVLTIFLIIISESSNTKKEHYSMGAINQLMAKGPQDTYLTGDAWKYIPYWYYNYPYSTYLSYNSSYNPWYIPTRYGKYNYPYYSPYGYYYYN